MWACELIACCDRSDSATSTSCRGRRSFFCASSVMRTLAALRGHVRSSSHVRRGCSDPGCAKRSPLSSIRASSSSSPRAVQGGATRRATWSSADRRYGPLGSPYRRSTYGPLGMPFAEMPYGPLGGQEVIHTHVRRSAVAVRALPGARRSLRSLCAIRIISEASSVIGRLAGRCPSGEEAQGDVALGARQPRTRCVPACSRSCRLPAALADEEQMAARSRLSAGCLSPRSRRRVGAPSATPVRAWRFAARTIEEEVP